MKGARWTSPIVGNILPETHRDDGQNKNTRVLAADLQQDDWSHI